MKGKLLKIISQLVWFKKSLLVLRFDHNTILANFVIEILPSAVLSGQAIPSKKAFCINLDVYFICWILTCCDQTIVNQVMTCLKCVPKAAYNQYFYVANHLKVDEYPHFFFYFLRDQKVNILM